MPTQYTVSIGQTAAATTASTANTSLAVGSSRQAGTFLADGTPFFIVPSGSESYTPTPVWNGGTGKNGSMIDPVVVDGTDPVHGFDSRVNANSNGPGMQIPPNFNTFFQSAHRETFGSPLATSATPKSVLVAKSAASVPIGGMYNGLDDIGVYTILQSAPLRPSFRPPYVSGSKTIYTRADVDYDVFPSLHVPDSGLLPDFSLTPYLRRPRIDIGASFSSRTIVNTNDVGDAYPAYDALYSAEVLLGACLDHENRIACIDRVIQYGIDMYHVALKGTNIFIANGGFGPGRLIPVIAAGMALNHSGMKNASSMTTVYTSGTNADFVVSAWGEVGHSFYGSATVDYPSGKPLFGRDRDPSQAQFQNGDLRDFSGLVDAHEIEILNGTVQAGSDTTHVKLDGSASGVDDAYNGYAFRVGSGGTAEYVVCLDYIGATKTMIPTTTLGSDPTGKAWAYRPGGTYMEQVCNYGTGHALAARLITGLSTLLNHGAFLDLQDRWVAENGLLRNSPYTPGFASPVRPYSSSFVQSVWSAYR